MNFLFGDYLWVVVFHIILVFILYFTTVKKPKTSSTLSPMEPIIICYKRYFDFKGRSNRSEYWWFYLYYNSIFILSIWVSLEYPTLAQIGFILVALTTIPYLTAKVRRLHDVNQSGWSLLAYLIPFGGYWLLFMNLKQGTKGSNLYGKEPETKKV